MLRKSNINYNKKNEQPQGLVNKKTVTVVTVFLSIIHAII